MDNITRELFSIGCDPSLIGFSFARESIKMYVDVLEKDGFCVITKEILPAVGERHQSTGRSVGSAIRYMIDQASNYSEDFRKRFEKFKPPNAPVTVSLFIAVLAEYVKEDNHENIQNPD